MAESDGAANTLGAQRLTTLAGIDVRLHVSVLLIFALIVWSLGGSVLPGWHPEWTPAMSWGAALAAGLLFFVSLLVHEFSHALTARRRGIETRAITLFLFGGVAEMTGDAQRPQDEFLIAIAGPIASLALALAFALLTAALMGEPMDDSLDISTLSLPATVTFWLSAVNMMLGLFNLLPGFPLDGGRVFRAALWWWSGDMVGATRQAAKLGSFFGWMLVAWGAWRTLSGDLANGLWLVLIGWFLHRLAQASAAHILMQRALSGFDVSAVMRTRFERIPANLELQQFIEDYMLRSTQVLWPVSDNSATGSNDVGFLTSSALLEHPERRISGLTVRDCMQALDPKRCLAPTTTATEAYERLSTSEAPLPVVDGPRVVGIIHQSDLLRWMAFH